ncbi:MAG: DNA repair protein RecN [Bacteroidota bacterium]|jgi:DNA repair protein RecN (Recombination protein N)|nr:DNA repair protein RecN [Bacteroidota bacterium]
MLTSLLIRNFALIEEIRITLGPGLTVMTGETGAGKSIVIDALGLVLGERADTTMIRQGCDKAIAEAELDAGPLPLLRPAVEALGAEWQPVLILRREVSAKGNSRAFVNDTPVPVNALRELGDRLVDIHGQHEHQSLLHAETHRAVLDSDPAIAAPLAAYRESYHAFVAVLAELDDARRTRDRIEERRVIAEHQLREITLVTPVADEDESIERELRMVEHSEKLATAANGIVDLLYDGEHNVVDMLGRCEKLLAEIARIDTGVEPLAHEVETSAAGLSEIARTMRDYLERIDFTPERAELLRHRLAEITALKRKFRLSLPELLDRQAALARELDGLDSIDDRIETLERRVESLRATVATLAATLTTARLSSAKTLGTGVIAALKDLGIKNARFDTRIDALPATRADARALVRDGVPVSCDEHGWDAVEFHLSTNVGEELKPLAKVVSGGEVSRIMLALKSIFAGRDGIPILVFDEIDVGVSGGIARKVGEAMHRLARTRQIIAITHLPQIAGLGDAHLKVEKHVRNGRTSTRIDALDADARVSEIARLLSGEKITPAALQSARELMIPS